MDRVRQTKTSLNKKFEGKLKLFQLEVQEKMEEGEGITSNPRVCLIDSVEIIH